MVWREGRENAGGGWEGVGNNSKKEIIEKKKENRRSGDRFLDVFFLASFVFV